MFFQYEFNKYAMNLQNETGVMILIISSPKNQLHFWVFDFKAIEFKTINQSWDLPKFMI
jgi:hypothetical protein